MKLVTHISDPHFGKHHRHISRVLLDELNALAPALVVLSGDVTQRARALQFDEARSWLRMLEAPCLIVPGNHDLPAFGLFARVFAPRRRYRAYVSDDLEPTFLDDELAVLGLDTTRRLTTKHGRVTDAQCRRAAAWFGAHPRRWRMLVAHHPLIVPPGFERDRAQGASAALSVFDRAAVDLVLTGHLHVPHSEGPAGRSPAHRMVAVHAGTCMATRLRGEPNGYNHVRLDDDTVTVLQREWAGDRFIDGRFKRYVRAGERLEKIADARAPS